MVFGPGYNLIPMYEFREYVLSEIGGTNSDFPMASRLLANKAFDVIESAVSTFSHGLAGRSLDLAMIGFFGFLATVFWLLASRVLGLIAAGRRPY